MLLSQNNKKESIIALAGTILFYGLLIVAAFFFGLSVPLPLPAEQGVEVNLGDGDEGFGHHPGDMVGMQQKPAATIDQHDEISTQSTEESVSLTKPKPRRETNHNPVREQEQVQEARPVEPQVNSNALFPGRRTTGTQVGTGEGIAGGQGDQGHPGGNPNATSYTGGGQGEGSGVSFELGDRSSLSLPKPQYTSREEGKVVVEIWVDKYGKVTKAEAGKKGTTASSSLWKKATDAALQSRFSPKDNAPDAQKGTITYIFRRAN